MFKIKQFFVLLLLKVTIKTLYQVLNNLNTLENSTIWTTATIYDRDILNIKEVILSLERRI